MDLDKVRAIKGRSPLRASSVIRAAEKKRGKSPGSLNFTYCPKIGRDFVFPSDLEFLHALHLEADESIATYEPDPDKVIAALGADGYGASKPDAITQTHDRQLCMVEVKYHRDLEGDLRAQLQVQVQQAAAKKAGIAWRAYTDKDAAAEERLLNDWLHIVVILSQSRTKVPTALKKAVQDVFNSRRQMTLAELRDMQLYDWYLVFPAVFEWVQRGYLSTDLQKNPLSHATQVWRSDRTIG